MNRKQRRAAKPTTASEIPMAHPPSNPIKPAKTLYELAAERQALLDQGKPFSPSSQTGTPSPNSTSTSKKPSTTFRMSEDGKLEEVPDDDDPLGPFGNNLFFALTLGCLHFTLDVLVHQQYQQDMAMAWSEIIWNTLRAVPVLFILLHFVHAPERSGMLVAQVLFLGTSVAGGCYLIYAANEHGYFAVMKKAPPLGTLWIWCVVEMRLNFALVSLASVVGYAMWNGYGMW
ncbi:MAG: hypothetical protein M1834_004830 [Cirrosporium novae-zelandiae]|nr:MAG: hypothetical protein M1834_004830 [Cirrosporium novae-zelandiae]